MEAAASIAGLVGLAGQTLQSCVFLNVFFADAKHAPKRIQDIRASLDFAATMLQKLQDSLNQQREEGAITASDLTHIDSALHIISGIIDELKTFVTKKAAHLLSSPSDGTAPAAIIGTSARAARNNSSVFRKGWERCNIAWNTKCIAGLESRLGTANSFLHTTIQRYTIDLCHENLKTSRCVQKHVNDVVQKQDMVLSRLNDVSDKRNQHFGSTRTVVAENTTQLKSLADEQTLIRKNITSIENQIRHGIDGIPLRVQKMVDDSIQAAFAQHMADITTRQTRERSQTSAEVVTELSDFNANDRVPEFSEAIHPSEHAFNSSSPGLKYTPRRLHYTSSTRFSFLLGELEISTICTERFEKDTDGTLIQPALRNLQTTMVLRPRPWLFKANLMLQRGSTFLKPADPLLNSRSLRVFYTITKWDAPILQAIHSSDYRWFRELMQTKQATPFDIIKLPGWSNFTVFQHLLVHGQRNPQLPKMAYFLAESGGVTYEDKGYSLYCIVDFQSDSDCNKIDAALLDVVIKYSATNPFRMPGMFVEEIERTVGKCIPEILAQDEWDAEEYKPEFEEDHGPGSWDFLCQDAGNLDDWNDHQLQCWGNLSRETRSSREDCRLLFGSRFVGVREEILQHYELNDKDLDDEHPDDEDSDDEFHDIYSDCSAGAEPSSTEEGTSLLPE